MARYVFEKYTRVWWVTTIAAIAAPTTTEINAGTDITSFIAKDGLKPPMSQNMVNNATIAETFDSELVGSWGGGGGYEIDGFRDVAADTFWNLCVYGTNGYLVVRYGILVTTAATATQKCQVWPAQMHQPVVHASATNTQVRFTEKFAITAEPSLNAVMA